MNSSPNLSCFREENAVDLFLLVLQSDGVRLNAPLGEVQRLVDVLLCATEHEA